MDAVVRVGYAQDFCCFAEGWELSQGAGFAGFAEILNHYS